MYSEPHETVEKGFTRLFYAAVLGLVLGIILYFVVGSVTLWFTGEIMEALAMAGAPVAKIIYGSISDPLKLIAGNREALIKVVSTLRSALTYFHGAAGLNALVVYFLLMSRGLKSFSRVSSTWRKPALLAYYASLLATVLMFASAALSQYYFSIIEQHVVSEGWYHPILLETPPLSIVGLALTVTSLLGCACCTLSFAILGYVSYRLGDDMNVWHAFIGYALIVIENVVIEILVYRGVPPVLYGLTSFKWFLTLIGWILVAWGFYKAGKMLEWGEIVIAGNPPNAIIAHKDLIKAETTE